MNNQQPFYTITIDDESRVSISKGNKKIGEMLTINLLAGHWLYTETRGLLTSVEGTCKGVCEGVCENSCYAVRDTKLHHNAVIPATAKNTLIMRYNIKKYFDDIERQVAASKYKVVRWHSSGEIENYEYLVNMKELAERLPNKQFYFYTKKFDLLERFLKEFKRFPENLVCNVSVWNNNIAGYNLEGLNQFIWDDGTDPELDKLVHCKAVSEPTKQGGKGHRTGTTCIDCGICWKRNNGHKVAVYNH